MDRIDQRGFDNQPSDFVGADEAARLLGVKRATLYAYASRGLVRSEPSPRGRGHRYSRSDLERLRTRVDARAGHGPVAAAALRFGEPVLGTAISYIDAVSGPMYRGQSAVMLATDAPVKKSKSFESVAELLWSGARPATTDWRRREATALVSALRRRIPTDMPPLYTLLTVTPHLALLDPGRFGAPRDAETERAKTLIRALAACSALSFGAERLSKAVAADSIAEVVATALGAPARAVPVIERTLILCADHELNASTFAARVVASTGADLYACVAAALAAMTGPRHGGASDRVEALCKEVGDKRRAGAVLAARARRGEAIPGFGHPLYPSGDPRVPPLLDAAARASKKSPGLGVALSVIDAMKRTLREPPNLDFGLVAVARALGLPTGSGALLFAIGRTAGWVAHALEQREAGYLLRPRSKYVGTEAPPAQETSRMHSAAT